MPEVSFLCLDPFLSQCLIRLKRFDKWVSRGHKRTLSCLPYPLLRTLHLIHYPHPPTASRSILPSFLALRFEHRVLRANWSVWGRLLVTLLTNNGWPGRKTARSWFWFPQTAAKKERPRQTQERAGITYVCGQSLYGTYGREDGQTQLCEFFSGFLKKKEEKKQNTHTSLSALAAASQKEFKRAGWSLTHVRVRTHTRFQSRNRSCWGQHTCHLLQTTNVTYEHRTSISRLWAFRNKNLKLTDRMVWKKQWFTSPTTWLKIFLKVVLNDVL